MAPAPLAALAVLCSCLCAVAAPGGAAAAAPAAHAHLALLSNAQPKTGTTQLEWLASAMLQEAERAQGGGARGARPRRFAQLDVPGKEKAYVLLQGLLRGVDAGDDAGAAVAPRGAAVVGVAEAAGTPDAAVIPAAVTVLTCRNKHDFFVDRALDEALRLARVQRSNLTTGVAELADGRTDADGRLLRLLPPASAVRPSGVLVTRREMQEQAAHCVAAESGRAGNGADGITGFAACVRGFVERAVQSARERRARLMLARRFGKPQPGAIEAGAATGGRSASHAGLVQANDASVAGRHRHLTNVTMTVIMTTRDPIAAAVSLEMHFAGSLQRARASPGGVVELCATTAATLALRVALAEALPPRGWGRLVVLEYARRLEAPLEYARALADALLIDLDDGALLRALNATSPEHMRARAAEGHRSGDTASSEPSEEEPVLALEALRTQRGRIVGSATVRGYLSVLTPDEAAGCRDAARKYLPPALATQYYD